MTINEAKQLRKLLEKQTESLNDQEVIEVSTYVERWKPDTFYKVNKRVSIDDNGVILLYKCLQEHLSQENHKPSQDSASLWTRIDVEHAGTKSDPIPYMVNMEVFKDKYYTEDNILYLCIRDSEIALQNKISELIDVYFQAVE